MGKVHDYPEVKETNLHLEFQSLDYDHKKILERGTLHGWYQLGHTGHTASIKLGLPRLQEMVDATGYDAYVMFTDHDGYGSHTSLTLERPITDEERASLTESLIEIETKRAEAEVRNMQTAIAKNPRLAASILSEMASNE